MVEVEPQITNSKMKSSYKLDFVNSEFYITISFAFMYKILSEELKIWFLLNIVLFKVIINWSASIRRVVAEFENLVY